MDDHFVLFVVNVLERSLLLLKLINSPGISRYILSNTNNTKGFSEAIVVFSYSTLGELRIEK
jgi:hypothetical protein